LAAALGLGTVATVSAVWLTGSTGHGNSAQVRHLHHAVRLRLSARCADGQRYEKLTLSGVPVNCAGPGQYPTDATSSAYSYFAAEFKFRGGTAQLVVTGPPLTGAATVPVSPSVTAVDAPGAQLADVDLYDNATSLENLATSGSVSLNPDGTVILDNVTLDYGGKPVTVNGTLSAGFPPAK
jgi:hypothetical protein